MVRGELEKEGERVNGLREENRGYRTQIEELKGMDEWLRNQTSRLKYERDKKEEAVIRLKDKLLEHWREEELQDFLVIESRNRSRDGDDLGRSHIRVRNPDRGREIRVIRSRWR
jgi:hypothetical protein